MKSSFNFHEFLKTWVFISTLALLASLTFSTALMEITFTAAFIAWVLLKWRFPTPFFFERKMFVCLALFIFLCVISFFWSEFPKQSFRGVFKMLKYFAVFWIAAETLVPSERHTRALRLLILLFLFLGLDGMWQYVSGFDLLRHFPYEAATAGPRISASFKNYGLLAAFIILFAPLLASRIQRKASADGFSLLAGIGILLGFFLVFWTRLRGAWIALAGGVIFYLFFAEKKIYLIFLLGAIFAGVLILPRSMLIHLDAQGKEQSLRERFYLWDRAIQVIEARPWTGTGINTYTVAHEKYDQTNNWRVRRYYAHNGYLQMAAETGLPSLAFLLVFFFFYFKNAFRCLRQRQEETEKRTIVGFLAGMAGFMILGMTDTVFHNPQAIMSFWFLAGWGVAYQRSLALSGRLRQ